MANKYDFRKISVMWRQARGHSRICIGTIHVSKDGKSLSFQYSHEGIEEAKAIDPNFYGYPGLPITSNNFPSEQVAEVFLGRLIDSSRKDVDDFYNFWLVDRNKVDDKIYILAQTQGLSITDMFEFVPQYYISHKPSFITDVAGLSRIPFDLTKLKVGDRLSFYLEKNNPKDSDAVVITFKGEKIGYIKKGHNAVFHCKSSNRITLTVWNVITMEGFEKLYLKIDLR